MNQHSVGILRAAARGRAIVVAKRQRRAHGRLFRVFARADRLFFRSNVRHAEVKERHRQQKHDAGESE
jgi:hypothetical protein